jgi:hypothetical protein
LLDSFLLHLLLLLNEFQLFLHPFRLLFLQYALLLLLLTFKLLLESNTLVVDAVQLFLLFTVLSHSLLLHNEFIHLTLFLLLKKSEVLLNNSLGFSFSFESFSLLANFSLLISFTLLWKWKAPWDSAVATYLTDSEFVDSLLNFLFNVLHSQVHLHIIIIQERLYITIKEGIKLDIKQQFLLHDLLCLQKDVDLFLRTIRCL